MHIYIGSEVEVLPDLLLSGAIAHIDATMIEWHGQRHGQGHGQRHGQRHGRPGKPDDRKKMSDILEVQQ